jgi:hypothetical protein
MLASEQMSSHDGSKWIVVAVITIINKTANYATSCASSGRSSIVINIIIIGIIIITIISSSNITTTIILVTRFLSRTRTLILERENLKSKTWETTQSAALAGQGPQQGVGGASLHWRPGCGPRCPRRMAPARQQIRRIEPLASDCATAAVVTKNHWCRRSRSSSSSSSSSARLHLAQNVGHNAREHRGTQIHYQPKIPQFCLSSFWRLILTKLGEQRGLFEGLDLLLTEPLTEAMTKVLESSTR